MWSGLRNFFGAKGQLTEDIDKQDRSVVDILLNSSAGDLPPLTQRDEVILASMVTEVCGQFGPIFGRENEELLIQGLVNSFRRGIQLSDLLDKAYQEATEDAEKEALTDLADPEFRRRLLQHVANTADKAFAH